MASYPVIRRATPDLNMQMYSGVMEGILLQAERHALEACVLEMSGKAAALERWLAENERRAVTGDAPFPWACLASIFCALQYADALPYAGYHIECTPFYIWALLTDLMAVSSVGG